MNCHFISPRKPRYSIKSFVFTYSQIKSKLKFPKLTLGKGFWISKNFAAPFYFSTDITENLKKASKFPKTDDKYTQYRIGLWKRYEISSSTWWGFLKFSKKQPISSFVFLRLIKISLCSVSYRLFLISKPILSTNLRHTIVPILKFRAILIKKGRNFKKRLNNAEKIAPYGIKPYWLYYLKSQVCIKFCVWWQLKSW